MNFNTVNEIGAAVYSPRRLRTRCLYGVSAIGGREDREGIEDYRFVIRHWGD